VTSDDPSANYAKRLAAVRAALRDAEAAQRYGESQALRLGEIVLRSLIEASSAADVPVDASHG
jgi:hypothetical protein